eukprot:4633185-Pyramimonas_sp.AAC.1
MPTDIHGIFLTLIKPASPYHLNYPGSLLRTTSPSHPPRALVRTKGELLVSSSSFEGVTFMSRSSCRV